MIFVLSFLLMKNKENAGSACAGLFVQSHLKSNFEGIWIHLDIASPVTEVFTKFKLRN
jgi:leucyl aminopeptidase